MSDEVEPRFRPTKLAIENLDTTEEVAYDIYHLWGYRFDSEHNKYSNIKCKSAMTRILSCIVASILFGVMIGGPYMYNYNYRNTPDYYDDLLIFDCFGTLGLYLLWVFTILLWSSASKTCIGPQEHFLLYNKMIMERVVNKHRCFERTDWAALTNMSGETTLTTHAFGFECGFLELRRPTHDLLSFRRFKLCKSNLFNNCQDTAFNILRVIIYVVIVCLYWMANNLENFIHFDKPMYIDKNIDRWQFKRIFIWFSTFSQLMLLTFFLIMWETMIDRIGRQFYNVKPYIIYISSETDIQYIKCLLYRYVLYPIY